MSTAPLTGSDTWRQGRIRAGQTYQKGKTLAAPSLKLKRASAIFYNYIKPKAHRSGNSSVPEGIDSPQCHVRYRESRHRPERATRFVTGPPIPSPKDIREFEIMNEYGWDTIRDPPRRANLETPERTKKVLPPPVSLQRPNICRHRNPP
ncbi:hypothetical protein L211DRAFT_853587 [Terfezia boudieri ATCC MYA-4762]|uniref:Uncharacterized protein n=1 Tax=Terfezia boudieri ATCC MYA-4762 TaxID=1051890 RepID=A0A3N4LBB0_9PEZI|nr:hypothetical protein L211DRAFT_853587 [Terfezia boudieri ATCC MYA-4762]